MKSGYTAYLPLASSMSWVPAFTGEYDDEEVRLLLKHTDPGATVLDVGACYGLYTVPLASHRRVVAFEPIDANRSMLELNIRVNGVAANVTVLPIALGSRTEEANMTIESSTGNAAFIDPEYWQTPTTQRVSVRVLDELSISERCGAMKLDVEAWEMEVLRGAEEFIARNRPVILGEFNLGYGGQIPAHAPLQWAQDHGYSAHEVEIKRHRVLDTRSIEVAPVTARTGAPLLLLPDGREG